MFPNLDDYHWLTSAASLPWLARARQELAAGDAALVRLTQALRKELSAAQTHLVLETTELRQRASEKFAQAEQMFFTRKGLEQATDDALAAYKAARFLPDRSAADLCCGIGGDLIGLATRGASLGVELDAGLAHFAQINCAIRGISKAQVQVADATLFPVESVAAWHIDPDRRPTGKRTTQLEFHSPSLVALEALLTRNGNGATKLAPATELSGAWQESAEREWLQSRGECRQQLAWFGSLARHPGESVATLVDSQGGTRTIVGIADQQMPRAGGLGRYLYEPAAAVLAARLTHVLCQEHSFAAVAPSIPYLTTDKVIHDPALAGWEVLEALPFDLKRLRALLRQRQIGNLELKKRGLELDLEKLRQKIISDGSENATLLIFPAPTGKMAVLARRMERKNDEANNMQPTG